MIPKVVLLITSAGLFATAASLARAETVDTRDVLGFGPNFFGTAVSPIPPDCGRSIIVRAVSQRNAPHCCHGRQGGAGRASILAALASLAVISAV